MNKAVKLIVLIVILAVLVSAYAIYSSYVSKQNENEGPVEDTTVEMLKIDSDSITSIEYTFEEEKVSLKKEEGVWLWSEDADYPVEQSIPKAMANGLSYITATRIVSETLDNQADFGLDTPAMTVVFYTVSGQKYEYFLGNHNTVAEGYYTKISGQDKVYLTNENAMSAFSYKVMDMLEKEKLPTFEAENVVKAEYKSGSIMGFVTTDSTGADFYTKPYSYFTSNSENKVIAVDGIAGAEFMSAVSGLSFDEADSFKPSAERLDLLGLSEQYRLELSVTYKKEVEQNDSNTSVSVSAEESFTVYIGRHTNENDEAEYYAMLKDSNIVYKLKGGDDLYNALQADFESKLVCPVNKKDVTSINVEISGSDKVYEYSLVDIEKSDKLTSIYNSVTSLTHSGQAEGTQKGELLVTVVFKLSDRELTLKAYKCNNENYIVSFDTFDNLLVSAEKVDGIINELKDYKA